MQNISRIVVSFTMIMLTFAVSAHELLPSEATVLINHALEATPGIDRRSITTPIVGRVRTEGLSEIERFMKGEVYFLHLQPEESRDAYWEFRDRNDDLGRVAWQRLMVIRINAFGMVDDLLDIDIPQYEEKFGIRSDDRFGMSFPLQRTADALIERGEIERALDLIVDHVQKHDEFDAPYAAYALPGQFFEVASQNGRADQFAKLNEWVLQGLNAAINDRNDTESSGPSNKEIPGEVFFSIYADRSLDSYQWTAEFIKLRDTIQAGVASVRGTPGQ